jgi:hypothetical protein
VVSSRGPLMTVRAAVVLLIAVVVGLGAGGVGYSASRDVAAAVLVAGGAPGTTVVAVHGLLGQ